MRLALAGIDMKVTIMIDAVMNKIHSFDPSMSCNVHFGSNLLRQTGP